MADFFKGAGGGLIGGLTSGILGMIGARQQFNQQKQLMGLQAQYNEQAAQANQQRAKELWDYTSYENQRKHMEAAGLNPALMYGMGGAAGGTTAGAGAAGGSGLGQAPAYGQILQNATGMGLQAAMLQSDIKLKESEAKKNDAQSGEALATIDGIIQSIAESKDRQGLIKADTKLKMADTDLAKANTELSKANTALSDASLGDVFSTIAQKNAATIEIKERTRGVAATSDVAERTVENLVKKSLVDIQEAYSRILVNQSTKGLNEAQAKGVMTGLAQKWQELEIKEKDVNNRKKFMEDQIENELKKIGIQEKEVRWKIITSVINTYTNLLSTSMEMTFKALPLAL